MRIIPFNLKLVNISKWSKILKLDILSSSNKAKKMIVIGDGTPDDIVVAILCNNFSCEDIVYVTKPEDKGI